MESNDPKRINGDNEPTADSAHPSHPENSAVRDEENVTDLARQIPAPSTKTGERIAVGTPVEPPNNPPQSTPSDVSEKFGDGQTPGPTSVAQDDTRTSDSAAIALPLTLPEGGSPAEHLTPEALAAMNASQRKSRVARVRPASEDGPSPSTPDAPTLLLPEITVTGSSELAATQGGEPPLISVDGTGPDNLGIEEPSRLTTGIAEPAVLVPPGATARDEVDTLFQRNKDGSPPVESLPLRRGERSDSPDLVAESIDESPSARSAPHPQPGPSSAAPSADAPSEAPAAPLPRVMVLVSLMEAEKFVHEEMNAMSRETSALARDIARDEINAELFRIEAQLRALLR